MPARLGDFPDEPAPVVAVPGRRQEDVFRSATAASDVAAAVLPDEGEDAKSEFLDEDVGKLADRAQGVPEQAVVQPAKQTQPAVAVPYKLGVGQSAA